MSSRFYTNVALIGDDVCVRMVEDDERKQFKVNYNPTLFLHSKEKSKYRSIEHRNLQPFKPGSIKDARKFLNEYKDVEGFQIYGQTNFGLAWVADQFQEEEIPYDMRQIRAIFMDIETEAENGFPDPATARERINVITYKDIVANEIYVFALEDYGMSYTPSAANVHYRGFSEEEDLIDAAVKCWKALDPDIITGWNVEMFDIPYIVNRMRVLFGTQYPKELSPWGKYSDRTIMFRNKEFKTYAFQGIAILDYLRLYWKFVLEPRENYKLDYIAEVETGRKKVDHTEYSTFREFYRGNFQKFVDYNIEDTVLVEEIDKKRKLIELTMLVAYQMRVNYEDVLSQVRSWDTYIYNHLRKQNIIIPLNEVSEKDEQFKGAYVKEPIPGMYKNIISFDVTSLYPSIIMTLNIGVETKKKKDKVALEDFTHRKPAFESLFEEAKENNRTLSVNGVQYSKEKVSFFSELVQTIFRKRMEARAKLKEAEAAGDENAVAKYDLMQSSLKISINSLYGAFGSEYFRFFDVDNAEAVTLTGQFILTTLERKLNEYLQEIFNQPNVDFIAYGDTDSIFVSLPDSLVDSICGDISQDKKVTFIDKLAKTYIQPKIDETFKYIVDEYLNAFHGFLSMKREVIATLGIWTGKKHYALNVVDTEGKRHAPKLKVKGLELKKAVVPKFCRDKMEEAVKMIFAGCTNDDMIRFITQIKDHFYSLTPEEISFPKGVGDMEKWEHEKTLYSKGTPLHFKAVLQYNSLVKKKSLDKKYQYIQEGEKVRLLYLKEPNPIKDKAIAFLKELPPEFGLHKYVDTDTQFEKAFLGPLKIILNVIGWQTEKRSNLLRFM